MPHAGEHVEHAEHVQHHAHDPFDRRVAVSMAVVAATLAAVTMLSHRAHNQTLQFQGEGNLARVESSNAWAQYQAKRLRQAQYQMLAEMLPLVPTADGQGLARANVLEKWAAQVGEYKKELAEITEKAKALERKADEALEASHVTHHRGDRYDLAELGTELALVLCSIAVLTKKRGYWFAGGACWAAGVALAASGLVMAAGGHHDSPGHGHDHAPAAEHAPAPAAGHGH